MSSTTILKAYSFSHKNTSLEARDRLAFSSEDAAALMADVREQLGSEMAVVSTCNRTEFYLFGAEAMTRWPTVKPLIARLKGLDETNIADPKSMVGSRAAGHVFAVAASLESLALGENQILGQLKDAHETLLDQPDKSPALDRLFQYAVRCGKDVRTDTALCEGTVSVSSVAVQLAEKIFGHFNDRRVLIVGAGQTAKKAATHFQEAGADEFVVVNRSESRGRAFADQFGGSYRSMSDLNDACTHADIVLVATSAQEYVVERPPFKDIMKRRHHRSIFLIDISNPRNIDPAIGEMSGVFLYNMDDLQSVVATNLDARRREIPAARDIVEHFVGQWDGWFQSLQVTPTIATLAQYFDAMREQELARHRSSIDDQQQAMLDDFSKGLVKKLLHNPIMYLRSLVQNEEVSAEELRVVRSMYNLQEFEEDSDDN